MSIFQTFISKLRTVSTSFPDSRKPSPNLRYSMEDITLGAFSVFCTQSPSFLSHQNRLERIHGSSNAQSLFGMKEIPTDNHIRKILDDVPPESFNSLFRENFEALSRHASFSSFKVLGDRFLIPLDGTQCHSSKNIYCEYCNYKKLKNGEIHYSHSFIGASLCSPNLNHVLPLEPEFIVPQDGNVKQDCEREACKRWLDKNGKYYGDKGGIILGDDLYACEPVCEATREVGLDFIFICKEDSHKTLYMYIEGVKPETLVIKGKRGKTTTYKYLNNVPINGKKNYMVNWLSVVEKDTDGKVLYKNAFIISLELKESNVVEIAQAGRTRWKIENETFNTLKTKGYNLEHNYGHGKWYLANVLATLNLLAFSIHSLAHLCCQKYYRIHELIKNRREVFEEIRTLTKYIIFLSWDHLFDTILDSFLPRGPAVAKKS